MKHSDIFKNTMAVIITKHKKDKVNFPVFAQTGMNSKLPYTIYTHTFGTFSGDMNSASFHPILKL